MRRRDFVKFFSSVPLVPLVLGKKQVGDMSGESKDGWLMVSTCLDCDAPIYAKASVVTNNVGLVALVPDEPPKVRHSCDCKKKIFLHK